MDIDQLKELNRPLTELLKSNEGSARSERQIRNQHIKLLKDYSEDLVLILNEFYNVQHPVPVKRIVPKTAYQLKYGRTVIEKLFGLNKKHEETGYDAVPGFTISDKKVLTVDNRKNILYSFAIEGTGLKYENIETERLEGNFIITIGTEGDLKDKLYFTYASINGNNDLCADGERSARRWYGERLLGCFTEVQVYSLLIKRFKGFEKL